MGKQLSKNFNSDEFKCHDGSEHPISTVLIDVLQTGRDIINRPIHINSGYRSPAYNKRIGGSPKSQHLKGTAADISIDGMTPSAVYAAFERILKSKNLQGGLGLYDTFVHVDVRATKARWDLRSKKK